MTVSKLKTFILQRTLLRNRKRYPTEWGKLFANHISDKGLLSRIYKDMYNSAIKQIT